MMSNDLVERLRDTAHGVRLSREAADEITLLRARLKQAERDRDNYNAMYESSLVAAVQMKRGGFRAGIEAAAKYLENVAAADDGSIREMTLVAEAIVIAANRIRALAEQKGE